MNWIGGARNRIKWQGERRLQKEFFDRRRLESARSCLNKTSNNKRKVSQDLKALHTVSRTHSTLKNEDFQRKPIKSVDMDKFQSCTRKQHDVDLGPTSPTPIPCKLLIEDALSQARPIPGIHERTPQHRDGCEQKQEFQKSKSSSSSESRTVEESQPFSFKNYHHDTEPKQLSMNFDPFASEDFQLTPLAHYGKKRSSESYNYGTHHSQSHHNGKKRHKSEGSNVHVSRVLHSKDSSSDDKLIHGGRVFTSTPLQPDKLHNQGNATLSPYGNYSKLSPILECSKHSPCTESPEAAKFKFKPHWMVPSTTKIGNKSISPNNGQLTPASAGHGYNKHMSDISRAMLYSYDADISGFEQGRSIEDGTSASKSRLNLSGGEDTSSGGDPRRKYTPIPLNTDSPIKDLCRSFEIRTKRGHTRSPKVASINLNAVLDVEGPVSSGMKPNLTDLDDDFQYKPNLSRSYSFIAETPKTNIIEMYRRMSQKSQEKDDDSQACSDPMDTCDKEAKSGNSKITYKAIGVKLADVMEEVHQLGNIEEEHDECHLNLKESTTTNQEEAGRLMSESDEADIYLQSESTVDMLLEVNAECDNMGARTSDIKVEPSVSKLVSSATCATATDSTPVSNVDDEESRCKPDDALKENVAIKDYDIASDDTEGAANSCDASLSNTADDGAQSKGLDMKEITWKAYKPAVNNSSLNGKTSRSLVTIVGQEVTEKKLKNMTVTNIDSSPGSVKDLKSWSEVPNIVQMENRATSPIIQTELFSVQTENKATSPINQKGLFSVQMENKATSPINQTELFSVQTENKATSPINQTDSLKVQIVNRGTSPINKTDTLKVQIENIGTSSINQTDNFRVQIENKGTSLINHTGLSNV